MAVLVDTSALYALLSPADQFADRAAAYWRRARATDHITHSYVISESLALIHKRLGWAALDALQTVFLPSVRIEMVDRPLHDAATRSFMSSRGRVSFVDHVSIQFARRHGISEAFAFDRDLLGEALHFPPAQ